MNRLAKTEIKLAKTGTDNISLQESDSNELVSYFLRDVRGRPDLAQAVQQNSTNTGFSSILEQIRILIEADKLNEAKALIDRTVTTTPQEQAELMLEQGRYYFFVGELATSTEILNKLCQNKDAIPTTRMTSYELAGQAWCLAGNIEKGLDCLRKATKQLEFLPYVLSGYVAGAHLIKTLSELGQFTKAKVTLNFLKNKLTQLSGDEIWLARKLLVLRGEVHLYKNMNEQENMRVSLKDAFGVAHWLEDRDMVMKCVQDYEALDLALPTANNINFIANAGALLIMAPKHFGRFDKSPVLAKMLQLILESPISTEDLFQATYRYPFDRQRHSNHLRAMLSKLRKKLPSNSLKIVNGRIELTLNR